MQEYTQAVESWQIISLLGGLGVILPAIMIFIGQLLNQKLIYTLQQQNNTQIESIKAGIAQNNAFIANLNANHSATFQKLLAVRIDATDKYWQSVLAARNEMPPIVSLVYETLSDDQLTRQGMGNGNELIESLLSLDEMSIGGKLAVHSAAIMASRPFLSHRLWALMYVYTFLIGRLTYILIDGYKQGDVTLWKKDDGVNFILPYALVEEEIKAAFQRPGGGVKYLLETIENKMIEEIRRFLSNDDFVNDSTSQLTKAVGILNGNPDWISPFRRTKENS